VQVVSQLILFLNKHQQQLNKIEQQQQQQQQQQQEEQEKPKQQEKEYNLESLHVSVMSEKMELSSPTVTKMSDYIIGTWKLQGTDVTIQISLENSEPILSFGKDVLKLKDLTESSFVIEWSNKSAPSTFVRKDNLPNALVEKDKRIWIRTVELPVLTPTEVNISPKQFSWRAKERVFAKKRDSTSTSTSQRSTVVDETSSTTSSNNQETKIKSPLFTPTTTTTTTLQVSTQQQQEEDIPEITVYEQEQEQQQTNNNNSVSYPEIDDWETVSRNESTSDFVEPLIIQSSESSQLEQSSYSLEASQSQQETVQQQEQNEISLQKSMDAEQLGKLSEWEKLLNQLSEMGFDQDENLKIGLLIEHEGNLEQIILRLISSSK